MLSRRNCCLGLVMIAVTTLSISALARIEDKKDDATGTWKWSAAGRNGQTTDVTLKLKQEGEKLTGTITRGSNPESEIKDGTIKDGDISFNVVRKRGDQEITTKYEGKLSGDSIKGKSSTERNGNTRTVDFEAKRAKE